MAAVPENTSTDGREPTRQSRAPTSGSGRKLAIECARSADSDKCEEIVVLDLRNISPVCDYFVIATGTSDRQMRAVADHMAHMTMAASGEKPFRISGLDDGSWIILDYVDVVVHLFDAEHRRFYDLEMLWGDSPRVNWRPRG